MPFSANNYYHFEKQLSLSTGSKEWMLDHRSPNCHETLAAHQEVGVVWQSYCKVWQHNRASLSNGCGMYKFELNCILKVNITYMSKWPICPQAMCLLYWLPLLNLPSWPYRDLPIISWLGKMFSFWDTKMRVSVQAHSEVALENSAEG